MSSAVELLTSKNTEEPLLSRYFGPILIGSIGFLSGCLMNIMTKRPVVSGIQKHFALSGFGALIGYYLEEKRNVYLAERDAAYLHYVTLHPEDFPTPERKKFAEVLESWTPIR